ncbi:MAG: alginate O-acetyltransferase complex protein AlgI [Methylophilaceae bacterium]|jgi:alginate O-acetyltransferase complex protein AlgI
MLKANFLVWILGALAIYGVSDSFYVVKFIVPVLVASSLAFLLSKYRLRYVEYLLFFTISIASLLGLTETLTGSHAESSNALLFGLSFYSASMAYLIAQNRFNYGSVLSVSNPLLLSTGPIALFLQRITHKSLKRRIEYYFPFIIVGTFMFQIVGSPLTKFFFLIENTDAVSSLAFAAIFELFVYVNFCGLSLLIYGVFGVFGYRIPLNFNQPFSSRNIVEFWRGWHTSLSQVLKVLFYNPLRKRYSLFYALLGVYVASSMWHGVTFNFLLWGSFHAFFFWLSIKILKQNNSLLPLVLLPFIIVVGRLIFADSDTDRLLEKLSFSFDGLSGISEMINVPTYSLVALLFGMSIIASEFIFRNAKVMQKRNYKFLRTPFALLVLCGFGVLFVSNVGVDYAVYGQR